MEMSTFSFFISTEPLFCKIFTYIFQQGKPVEFRKIKIKNINKKENFILDRAFINISV